MLTSYVRTDYISVAGLGAPASTLGLLGGWPARGPEAVIHVGLVAEHLIPFAHDREPGVGEYPFCTSRERAGRIPARSPALSQEHRSGVGALSTGTSAKWPHPGMLRSVCAD